MILHPLEVLAAAVQAGVVSWEWFKTEDGRRQMEGLSGAYMGPAPSNALGPECDSSQGRQTTSPLQSLAYGAKEDGATLRAKVRRDATRGALAQTDMDRLQQLLEARGNVIEDAIEALVLAVRLGYIDLVVPMQLGAIAYGNRRGR